MEVVRLFGIFFQGPGYSRRSARDVVETKAVRRELRCAMDNVEPVSWSSHSQQDVARRVGDAGRRS